MINKKQAPSAILGTLLQWYDFSLFGFLAPIIAKVFFDTSNSFVAIASTFSVFAVGYLMAPLGALFFGVIGDRYGRKQTLLLSVLLMTIPTFIMALLPGVRVIGIAAPIILILCRMLQGFVASAEFAGSAVFLLEHARASRQCFYSCLASCSYSVGMLLGALVCSFVTAAYLPAWSWRIAFALSGVGAIAVFYFRRYLEETPSYKAQTVKLDIKQLLKGLLSQPKAVLHVLGIACYAGVLSFGVYVYGVTFLHQQAHLPLAQAVRFITYALVVDIVVEPFAAMLADRFGKRRIMLIGLVAMVLLLPVFVPMLKGPTHSDILIGLLSLSFLIAISCAPSNALMALMFPVKSRLSHFGFSFNVGMSVFGGTAPLVLAALVHHFSVTAMVVYFLLSALVAIAALAI